MKNFIIRLYLVLAIILCASSASFANHQTEGNDENEDLNLSTLIYQCVQTPKKNSEKRLLDGYYLIDLRRKDLKMIYMMANHLKQSKLHLLEDPLYIRSLQIPATETAGPHEILQFKIYKQDFYHFRLFDHTVQKGSYTLLVEMPQKPERNPVLTFQCLDYTRLDKAPRALLVKFPESVQNEMKKIVERYRK